MSEAAAAAVSEVEAGDSGGEVAGSPVAEPANGLDVQTANVGSDWRDSLDPSIRASLDVDSLEDLAKGYVSAQKMIGGSIRIPGKDAGQDDWNKFYEKFADVPGLARYNPDDLTSLYEAAGRPKDASGYDMPELGEDLLNLAHEAGLNRSQLEKIAMFNDHNSRQADVASDEAREAGINSLRQEWGLAFDRKIEEGQRAVSHLNGLIPGLAEALDRSGAGDDPAVIKLFQSLGSNLKEGQGFEGTHSADGGLTPYEARMQIQEILNNPQHPYHDGDELATTRFLELHKFASAG